MSYNSLAEKKTERILFQQQKINKTIIIAERNQNLKTSFIKNSTVSQVEHKNPRQWVIVRYTSVVIGW